MSQRITLQHINKEVVRPVTLPPELTCKKIKGASLFPDPYSNIGLIARKKSGKTSAINKILRKCAGKDTQLIFFVSTVYKDPTWKEIINYFENKGNNVIIYQSLFEDGVNHLEELVNHLQTKQEEDEDDEEKKIPKPKSIIKWDDDEEEEEKPKKSKYLAPEYIIVFDDLSNELKNKSIIALMKKNRWFKCKIILSTQYIHDIAPEALKQLDYWLVFKGQPLEKIEKIHKDADVSIPLDLFIAIYKRATEQKYSFLYIDTQNNEYRKNFNCKFNIPDDI